MNVKKPIIGGFNEIAPLIIQKYERYLPTAFDESMTLLEKVNKIIQHLHQLTEISNEVITQWNEVMEWVMNNGLSEAVKIRLDKMVADGTLANIINEELLGSKAGISVSEIEPTNPHTDFWFKDMKQNNIEMG